jgi:anti-anti-sigma factor
MDPSTDPGGHVSGTAQHDDGPSIDVAPASPAEARYDAVVRMHGGHDIATSRELRDALAPLEGDVLLDLSDCQFIDSSVIFVIFAEANRRTEHGTRLELLVPRGNTAIRRTLEIACAREILPVHESLGAA